jgi:hypothetical protein
LAGKSGIAMRWFRRAGLGRAVGAHTLHSNSRRNT